MAALTRPTEATYAVHENVTVDTRDREDHTFCGIMFPIKCKDMLPVDKIIINSISARGALGPITIWISKNNEANNATCHNRNALSPVRPNSTNISMLQQSKMDTSMKVYRNWVKIYEETHTSSFHEYCEFPLFHNPIMIRPGESCGIYIHSALRGDSAIVYDNKRHETTHDDDCLTIYPGKAHLSSQPFGSMSIWGYEGNAWRYNREFVGRISYGVVYKLWNPKDHEVFGERFQNDLVWILFLCQRRWESPMSMLPDECIFYVLNMCRWDWVKKKDKKKKGSCDDATENKTGGMRWLPRMASLKAKNLIRKMNF